MKAWIHTPRASDEAIYRRNLAAKVFSLVAAAFCWLGAPIAAQGEKATAELKSPDGQIVVTFNLHDDKGLKDGLFYSVSYRGKPILTESRLGLELKDGARLDNGFKMAALSRVSHDEQWRPVYGERSRYRDRYNQLVVELQETEAPQRQLNLTFRAYNEGAAFCYTIPKQPAMDRISIVRENSEFRFSEDHVAWAVYSAQGNYERVTLTAVKSGCERPLVLQVGNDCYAAVGEARLVDYARMKLAPLKGVTNALVSALAGGVEAALPLTTPWRFVMAADSPGRLLENNFMVLNLNDPCAIVDTSWIKPGKVIRDVTLTTIGGKACVDFAAKRGLQYIEFDAGWYGREDDDQSDASEVNVDPKRSKGPLDLHEVIRYARDCGIGVILYVNRRALEKQLDQILPLYRKWGVAGVKYGFVNVGTQPWTSWLHEAVRKAAEHQLMVDVHDEYRPTGYSRTYPNLMTQEGVAGDETSPANANTLTLLFSRYLAGAADNTLCYYDQRVDKNATHAYQLAKAVCLYSPFQFLYWYDRPPGSPQKTGGAGNAETQIGDEPELEFYNQIPTVWDDTRVLFGQIGEFAVIARRSGANWFIGGMNSGEARTFDAPLDFLDRGKKYTASIYSDDASTPTRTHVRIQRQPVDADVPLKITMSAQGGQAVRIAPADEQASAGATNQMHFVLVSKSHFDIGYSALARDVEHEYRTTMIDRALETMEQNAKTAGPGEQFVWTIPGWPMQTILWDGQNPVRKKRIEEALKRGNLVIHALPYTIETGSADMETLARSFIYSSRISRQYGLPMPNDAKMTDVPGHDWIIPTLLNHAGVKFFHLGANPTNIQAKQPRIFWWEGPDGSRVLTMFSNGYDSGLLPPADWPHKTWLAMVMGGDNEGPPSADAVRGWIATIRKTHPNAKITVGRMEDFADSLLAEKPELPVVRGSVSDSWIHGLASSPNAMKTLANVRPKLFALESLRTLDIARGIEFQSLAGDIAAGYDNSLRWTEHTWGLANQHFVPGLHGESFFKAYAGGLPPHYEHMVESWREHDKFAFRIEDSIVPKLEAELHTLAENVKVPGLRIVVFNPLPWRRDGVVDFAFPFMGSIAGKTAVQSVDDGEPLALQTWGAHSHRNGRFVAKDVPPLGYKTYVVTDAKPKPTALAGDLKAATIENRWLKITLDPARGRIASIIDKATGTELVDPNSPHGFGQYLYQQFDRKECDAYISSYILPQYTGSHGPITAKSTFVPETAKHIEFSPENTSLEITQNGFSITARLTPPATTGDATHTAGLEATLYAESPFLDLKVSIVNHPATENPEAGWICLPLAVRNPQYRLRTPGALTDPAKDMIEGGNFAFFWTQGGMSVCDPGGRGVGICSPDAPALSIGEPGIYKFKGKWHNPKSAVYVHLFNNKWNTNFRSFWSGELSARVRIWPIADFDAERDLVTPSEEAVSPLLTGLSNYKPGLLPAAAQGISLSRKGVRITALGPNPDGAGTLLRLWELAGQTGDCALTLPEVMKVKKAQAIDLRGRPAGEPVPVRDGQFMVLMKSFAPSSFLLTREE